MRDILVKVVGLGALALMLIVMDDATKLFNGNLKFIDVETEVSFWGRGSYQPDQETIERTTRSVESLIEDSEEHPSYHNLNASILAWMAYWEVDSMARERCVQQSIAAQTQAIESRPAHRQSWLKLIEYLANTNNSGETEEWARNRLAGLQNNTQNNLRK
ncbi:MAG: hypothetical protein ACJASY_002562 [Halioglobus sp.]|jgi:hypothetical protein